MNLACVRDNWSLCEGDDAGETIRTALEPVLAMTGFLDELRSASTVFLTLAAILCETGLVADDRYD